MCPGCKDAPGIIRIRVFLSVRMPLVASRRAFASLIALSSDGDGSYAGGASLLGSLWKVIVFDRWGWHILET